MANCFYAYGARINSEIDLSSIGLSPCPLGHVEPIVDINISIASATTFSKVFKDNETSVDARYGFYYKHDVAFYEFFSGKELRVTPLTERVDADFIRIMLNYPLACMFYQKDYYVLHASAVLFNGKVILFPGLSLTGKSTIAAFLLKNGGKLITEDIAVIRFLEDEVQILPSYPFLKISDVANKSIGLFSSGGVTLLKDRNNRKGFILPQELFHPSPVAINLCIFASWNESGTKFTRLKFKESIQKLLEASMSIYPLTRAKESQLLRANSEFLRRVPSYSYRREKTFSSFNTFLYWIDTIETLLVGNK